MTCSSTPLPRPTITTILALCLAIVFGSGCASVPEGTAVLREKALSFTPPAGQAGVYVIRLSNGGFGGGILWKVSLDTQEFGSLSMNSYLYGTVNPGKHWLYCQDAGQGATFEAQAGRNYFFKLTPGWFSMQVHEISEEEGRRYTQNCKLSLYNRFEALETQGKR